MALDHIPDTILIVNPYLIIILKHINLVFMPFSEERLMEVMSISIPHIQPLSSRQLKPVHLLMVTDLNVLIPQLLFQLSESRTLIVVMSFINSI